MKGISKEESLKIISKKKRTKLLDKFGILKFHLLFVVLVLANIWFGSWLAAGSILLLWLAMVLSV